MTASTGDSTPTACRSEDEVCVLRSHCHLSCQWVPPGDSTPDLARESLLDHTGDPVHEWFLSRMHHTGTHFDDCWKDHADCAYWLGRSRSDDVLMAEIRHLRTEVASQAAEIAQLRAAAAPSIAVCATPYGHASHSYLWNGAAYTCPGRAS